VRVIPDIVPEQVHFDRVASLFASPWPLSASLMIKHYHGAASWAPVAQKMCVSGGHACSVIEQTRDNGADVSVTDVGDPAEWDRLTMINQLSPMHITRWLTPPMVEKGALLTAQRPYTMRTEAAAAGCVHLLTGADCSILSFRRSSAA